MKVDISTAILAIDSTAWVGVSSGDINKITWHDGNPNKITNAQILAKQEELQAEYNAQAYARSRATEYPSIKEQLDLQYWDKVNSTDKWGEAVKAVKDKYPKG